jgi:iron-sulfur cluster repair protein YtfE (RIC family)
MSFEPVKMKLLIEAQIVTFFPQTTQENLNHLRQVLDKVLKEHGAKQDFLVGHTRVNLEYKHEDNRN